MAGKPAPKKEEAPKAKSRKPRFKGINYPRVLAKGFRVHGNKPLIKAALDRQRFKPAAVKESSK